MLLASAALHAGIANGMGLGNIDVQSYLGAPLEAQIHLLSPGDLGAAQVRVNLARTDVYQRFDARYEASHGDIQFDVITTASGDKAVLVRTSKRVVEPFLDIVVELSWPTGTTYRRYNLLLDPPGYASRWRTDEPQLSPTLTQTVIKSEPVTPKAVVPALPLEGNYVVQAGDSLWKVASKFRPATGLSVQKTMDILYQQNPQAFVRGDRNLLKLGATLSVPAVDLIEQPAAPSLEQLASEGYQQKQSSVTFSQETVPSAVAVVPVNSEASEVEQLKAQLAELRAERKELVAFQEQVLSEMQKLQAQRSVMQETIALAEEVTREIKQESIQESTGETMPPPTLQPVPERALVQQTEQRGAVAQDLIGVSNKAPDTLIEKSGSVFWYLLAMLPLGLLILFMGIRARRVDELKRTEEVRDEDLYELVFGTKRDRSKADSPDQVEKAIHQIKEKAVHQEAAEKSFPVEEEEASRDDVDQMIELYILYNQYQKALGVIQAEIAKRPGRKDLRLRLMQVYAKTQDWDAFDEQMEVLQRLGDEDTIKAAEQLRGNFEYEALHRDAS
jgi:pilus assembly protein FimV